MKTAILILNCVLLSSCAIAQEPKKEVSSKPTILQKVKARITYYYPEAPFWRKVSCTKTKTAKEGTTVAAHPDFKFGTKLYIPQLKGKIGDVNFVVKDRGSAVTKKRASRGKGYVFDIFVDSRSDMSRLERKAPEWMDVYIVKN